MHSFACLYSSPLGKLTLFSNGTHLTRLCFDTTLNEKEFEKAKIKPLSIFDESKAWLDEYFKEKEPNFSPKILLQGSEFQCEVWNLLRLIPYGTLTSYGALAGTIARKKGITKMSARAVGTAIGRNPMPIIIPCHRVIGANSNLTGFTGGIDKKIALLQCEHIDISKLTLPKNSAKIAFANKQDKN